MRMQVIVKHGQPPFSPAKQINDRPIAGKHQALNRKAGKNDVEMLMQPAGLAVAFFHMARQFVPQVGQAAKALHGRAPIGRRRAGCIRRERMVENKARLGCRLHQFLHGFKPIERCQKINA